MFDDLEDDIESLDDYEEDVEENLHHLCEELGHCSCSEDDGESCCYCGG